MAFYEFLIGFYISRHGARISVSEFRNNIEAKLGDRLFFEDINRIKVAKIQYKLIDARKLVNELCKHLGASYSESMKANSDD